MLLAIVVALGDVLLHLFTRQPSLVDGLLYLAAVALVMLLWRRSATAAFVAALALASFTGGAFVLLLWISYQAGRGILARSHFVIAVGAALGALGGQLATTPRSASPVLTTFLVFVALPMLAGRYVAQHERLLSTLEQNSRLRIARDMHDSLGHRLSLASIQAAALEVSDLPAPHRQAVTQLATSVRAAADELYQMVATLRGNPAATTAPLPAEAIDRLAHDFNTAGIHTTLQHHGTPRALAPEAGEAAYRVAQEGLTNAAKHAPGQPITVRVSWDPDTLILSLTNPAPASHHHHPVADRSLPTEPPPAAAPLAAAPLARPPHAAAPLAGPPHAAAPLAGPPHATAPLARPPHAGPPLAEPPPAGSSHASTPQAEPPLVGPPHPGPTPAGPPHAASPLAGPPHAAAPPHAEPSLAVPPHVGAPLAGPPHAGMPHSAAPPHVGAPLAGPPHAGMPHSAAPPHAEPSLAGPPHAGMPLTGVQQSGARTGQQMGQQSGHGLAEHGLAGHGLAGLEERVRQAGGFLDYRFDGGEFRLVAMLPYPREPVSRTRIMAIGIATAVLMFMLLPATMVVGVASP